LHHGEQKRLGDLPALAAILLGWILLVASIGLGGDYPLNDDWAYAQSARGLLSTGRLRISDWLAPSVASHAAWGALALRLFGDTHVSLRAGTLIFAALALCSLYGIGRRAGLSAGRALLPVLALGTSPWFVHLSFTYMTDVPWLAMVLLATLLCARALPARGSEGAPSPGWLFLAGLTLTAAALTRQFAIILVPGFLLAFWACAPKIKEGASPWRAPLQVVGRTAALWGPVAIGYGLFHLWYTKVHGATLANRETLGRLSEMRVWFPLAHAMILLCFAGLWLLPLWIAVMPNPLALRGRARWFTAAAFVAFALGMISLPEFWNEASLAPAARMRPVMPYLGNLLNSLSVGPLTLTDSYVNLTPPIHESVAPDLLMTLGAIVGAVGMAGPVALALRGQGRLLLAPLLGLLRRRRAPDATDTTDAAGAAREDAAGAAVDPRVLALLCGPAAAYLTWHLLTGTVMFDRYLVPLFPVAWLLALSVLPGHRVRAPLLCAALLPMLALSVFGTREYFSWNDARALAVRDLLRAGVPASDINAGFEWNGPWRFEATKARSGVNSLRGLFVQGTHYHLSFGPPEKAIPLQGCPVKARYPFTAWPGTGPRFIYVMHCPVGGKD
jgi:4-amino-4-deoxy-L-arabinose transferase-like glycosyltransferase